VLFHAAGRSPPPTVAWVLTVVPCPRFPLCPSHFSRGACYGRLSPGARRFSRGACYGRVLPTFCPLCPPRFRFALFCPELCLACPISFCLGNRPSPESRDFAPPGLGQRPSLVGLGCARLGAARA
jgi:hypothetical protein